MKSLGANIAVTAGEEGRRGARARLRASHETQMLEADDRDERTTSAGGKAKKEDLEKSASPQSSVCDHYTELLGNDDSTLPVQPDDKRHAHSDSQLPADTQYRTVMRPMWMNLWWTEMKAASS